MEDYNKEYDNRITNGWMTFAGTLIRIFERFFVTFFRGLTSAVEMGTPSMLGFLSAILPVLAPLPVALMTAGHLETYLGWTDFQSITMAAVIEIAGFVVYVTLVESFVTDGWKGTLMQFVFFGCVVVYQVVLISINAVLSSAEGRSENYVLIMTLLSLLPAIGSIIYGYRSTKLESKSERRYQESRKDRKDDKDRRSKEKVELAKAGAVYRADTPFGGRRAKVEKICNNCGKKFKASSPKAKFCPGGACKQAYYRKTHGK